MDDWWTCHQFDSAITYGGQWLESKLLEYDDKGKPKHTLKDLLEPTLVDVRVIQMEVSSTMGVKVIRRKRDEAQPE